MHLGERSSNYIFAAVTLFLAALAGLLIPLASGGASRSADAAWTPPTAAPTRQIVAATATSSAPQPTRAVQVQAQPTRQAPTATAIPATPTLTAMPTTAPEITAAPTVTATPALAPEANAPLARITGDAVNLRAGPGTSFRVVATAAAGDTFTVTGQAADSAPAGNSGLRKWWRVCCVAGEPAWAASDFIDIVGDAGLVPIAQ